MAVIKGAGAAADIETHKRATRAKPRDASAHALLGQALQKAGRFEEALASQRRALELNPSMPGLYGTIGQTLYSLGQHQAAADAFCRALAAQPDDAGLHRGLSNALRVLGQYDAALASALRAVALAPDDADMLASLAAAQFGLADYESAANNFRRVLALQPDRLDGAFGLGVALMHGTRYEEAVAAFLRVLELDAGHHDTLLNLAMCQRNAKQHEASVASYQRALEIKPSDPLVLHELGVSLWLADKLEESIAVQQEGLRRFPGDGRFLCALAQCFFDQGQWEEAIDYAKRSVAAIPDSPKVYSFMLFMLSHCCSDPAELTALHRGFGERFGAARAAAAAHGNERDPARRINIGFVSADLCNHAVAKFVEPVFALLKDSTQLTLHVYYNNPIEDIATRRLKGFVPNWRSVHALDDEALDRQIRDDGIDILIDLAGHSASNRLPVFARKPAPIQASWIGYAGTTGLTQVDYYLGDQFFLPEGKYDDQFTEKIVRLPLSAPFLPEPSAAPINPLPALANGYLTFGSFHRASKLNQQVIAQWAKLLRALPDAKILLGGQISGTEKILLDWFDAEGIDQSRLILRRRVPMGQYMAQHHEVDICLSPFPYTGGTTVAHALWMGVPTLTATGPTNPSHAAACYMAHVGLSSFIAHDDDTLVKLGVFLAQNLPTVAALRETMRERFVNSMLGFPGITAASLELAFRLMWQRWCAGMPAEPFQVTLADLAPAEEQGAGA